MSNFAFYSKKEFISEPEGVSVSVLEVEVAELVLDEDVAGAEVEVALGEDVGQDLLLGRLLVLVALKVLDGVAAHDLADELSGLTF